MFLADDFLAAEPSESELAPDDTTAVPPPEAFPDQRAAIHRLVKTAIVLNALDVPHGRGGAQAAIDWLGEQVKP